ncbi:MAG: helix-turn-helix transcriptional regulator [Candidatus Krumholzibacteria bacterium]|nr:helix-turn-helix transcriptional regulator [Candidatus Krumholzibacteria bacterium]
MKGTDLAAKNDNGTFDAIAGRLRAMSDPARLAIIHCLCGGEKNVSCIVEETGYGQASVSKHLSILRRHELVSTRRDHRKIFYSLTSTLPEDICRMVCRSIEDTTSDRLDALRSVYTRQSTGGTGIPPAGRPATGGKTE